MTTPPRLRRVNRREPCPICQDTDWCEIRDDGAIHCMRVESDHPCEHRMGGWWHNLPHNASTAIAVVPSRPTAPAVQPPDPATRDAIYRTILAKCALSEKHRQYLNGCGLLPSALAGYGTSPALAIEITGFSNEVLASMPGIYLSTSGALSFNLRPGLLMVAVQDVAGRIVGIQVRKEQGGYFWLRSSSKGGASSGAPAHVVRPDSAARFGPIWITEGPKKAHVASLYTHAVTIGIAGHSNYTNAIEALQQLMAEGATCAVIALDEDSDPETVLKVQQSRLALADACFALGLAVRFARWDNSQGKGIDDLFSNGHTPQIEVVTSSASDNEGDARTGSDGRKLSLTEQAARFRVIRNVLLSVTGMKPADKLALLVAYELTGSYPSKQQPEPPDPKPLNMSALGERVGVSAKTASVALKTSANVGLLEHATTREPGTGHTIVAIAAGRPLGFNEQIAMSEQRAADVERKRQCKECGSENLITVKRHICMDCGASEEEPIPQAEGGIRNRVGPVRQFKRARPGLEDNWGTQAEAEDDAASEFRNPESGPALDNLGTRRQIPEATITDQGAGSTPLPVNKPVPESGIGSEELAAPGGVRCVECGQALAMGELNPGCPPARFGPPAPDWSCRCPDCASRFEV